MTARKALRTEDEIDAAYPVHKLFKDHEPEMNVIQDFLGVLQDRGIRLCQKGRYQHFNEFDDEEEWYEPVFGLYSYGIDAIKIFELMGLDVDAFWREKEDMLNQLRSAQEEDDGRE